jgi:hypothetical protein
MASKNRTWRWRVEPGMEDAFQDLLGWLLSSQQDAEIEAARPPSQTEQVQAVQSSEGLVAFQGPCRRVRALDCCVRAAQGGN